MSSEPGIGAQRGDSTDCPSPGAQRDKRPPRPSLPNVYLASRLQNSSRMNATVSSDNTPEPFWNAISTPEDETPQPPVNYDKECSLAQSSSSFHSASEPPPPVACSSGASLSRSNNSSNLRSFLAVPIPASQPKAAKSGQKRLEQREAIIMELIQSERDYLSVLKKTRDIFFGDRYNAKLIGIDLDAAFGNIDEVIDAAEDLLRNLELNNMSKYDRDKCIGLCFIDVIEKLQRVYGEYCRHYNTSMWQKYSESEPERAYMNGKLEQLKEVTDCFDVPTILIKPVQRLAKYPLLLHELSAVTDAEHPDKKDLEKALKVVTDAVMSINKLRAPSSTPSSYNPNKGSRNHSRAASRSAANTADPNAVFNEFNKKLSITDVMDGTTTVGGQARDKPFINWISSTLSLHSFKKKTSRLSTRISASLGLGTLTRDEEFERLHDSHKHLRKTIRCFLKDLQSFLEHLESFMHTMQRTSEHVTFHRDPCFAQNELVDKNKACVEEHHHEFKKIIDRQVISVINKLLSKFVGPANLIAKRHDKLLDFDSKTRKLDSCKNLEKRESLREQQLRAKDLYERLNRQLIDELPSFNSCALDIFKTCLIVFLKARRQFISRYTREATSLLETPLLRGNQRGSTSSAGSSPSPSLMTGSMSDIVDQFNHKHSIQVAELFDRERLLPSAMFQHQQQQQLAHYMNSNQRLAANDNIRNETCQDALDTAGLFHNRHSMHQMRSSSPLCSTPDNVAYNSHFNDMCAGSAASTRSSSGGNAATSSIDSASSSAGRIGSVDLNAMNDDRRRLIMVASWPFTGSESNQLNLAFGQQVILIKECDERGNSEWSLVEDRSGQRGYVPSAYIKAQP